MNNNIKTKINLSDIDANYLSQMSEISVTQEQVELLAKHIAKSLELVNKLFDAPIPADQAKWTTRKVKIDELRSDEYIDYVNPKINPITVSRVVKKGSE